MVDFQRLSNPFQQASLQQASMTRREGESVRPVLAETTRRTVVEGDTRDGFESSFLDFSAPPTSYNTFHRANSDEPEAPLMNLTELRQLAEPNNTAEPSDAPPSEEDPMITGCFPNNTTENQTGDNQVLVIDGGTHAGAVKSVLQEQGVASEDIVVADDTQYQGTDEELNTLDQVIEYKLSGGIEDTAAIIREQFNENPGIRTVNFSSEHSRLLTVQDIRREMDNDPERRVAFLEELNLPESASEEAIVTALIDRTESIAQSSERYATAQDAMRETRQFIEDQGAVFTVAAGNSQEELEEVESLYNGTLSSDFSTNIFAIGAEGTDHSDDGILVVGSVDDQNTPTLADDTLTDFSSQGNRVDLAADGVNVDNVPGLRGTSFSSPAVAGAAYTIAEQYPQFSPQQIEEILIASVNNQNNLDPNAVGAGVFDPQAALALAGEMANQVAA